MLWRQFNKPFVQALAVSRKRSLSASSSSKVIYSWPNLGLSTPKCTTYRHYPVSPIQNPIRHSALFRVVECCDLLLAAGYHKARVPTLSPFDKVVGGMCW